jgi:hypothetical protein
MFDFRAERVLASIDESLARMGVEYIDVGQVSPLHILYIFTALASHLSPIACWSDISPGIGHPNSVMVVLLRYTIQSFAPTWTSSAPKLFRRWLRPKQQERFDTWALQVRVQCMHATALRLSVANRLSLGRSPIHDREQLCAHRHSFDILSLLA